jgi:hypothetical protein
MSPEAQSPAGGGTPTPGTPQEGQGQAAGTAAPVKFEEWLKTQDAGIQASYEANMVPIRNAVQATRQERDALGDQVKDLLKTAAKGSEMEKTLQEFQGKLAAAERRASFLESATQPGIDCKNPKAALAIATASDLFTRQGQPDWNAIKAEAPELFGRTIAPGNAGSGTGAPPPAQGGMNAFIRKASGRS